MRSAQILRICALPKPTASARSCRNEHLTRVHTYARRGILSLALFRPCRGSSCRISHRSYRKSDRRIGAADSWVGRVRGGAQISRLWHRLWARWSLFMRPAPGRRVVLGRGEWLARILAGRRAAGGELGSRDGSAARELRRISLALAMLSRSQVPGPPATPPRSAAPPASSRSPRPTSRGNGDAAVRVLPQSGYMTAGGTAGLTPALAEGDAAPEGFKDARDRRLRVAGSRCRGHALVAIAATGSGPTRQAGDGRRGSRLRWAGRARRG